MSTKYILESTDDLNNVYEPGVYDYMNSINRPNMGYGQLLVCYGGAYCFQVAFERIQVYETHAYYRSCNINDKIWTQWERILTESQDSWRSIGLLSASTYTELGNSNHMFALKCSIESNGNGTIMADGNKFGLPFCAISSENGKRTVKATTSVSGTWYVKDLCK